MHHNQQNPVFPFTAVVGQDDLKKALLLSVIDPAIGGVLAIGDRGAGKTTLIRSLSQLMSGLGSTFPFVNLPIGSSEDRLLGHVNVEQLIQHKREIVEPGLLAKANLGILYVDEINLLNDYLMDILLDASASGSYYLEREGLSRQFDSRFLLIGSMNPEEGDLRPQLRDRFGFCVEVITTNSREERVQIIENRLQFDENPQQFIKNQASAIEVLRDKIQEAKRKLTKIDYSKENLNDCVSIALAHEVEGMRADVLLMKAARAWCAFCGKTEISKEDIEEIAPLVLLHRSNQKQQSGSSTTNEPKKEENQPQSQQEENQQTAFEAVIPDTDLKLKNGLVASKTGNVGELPIGKTNTVDYITTNEKIDVRKTVTQYIASNKLEIKKKNEIIQSNPKLLFLIDSSGSMLKDKAINYAKGLIDKTIEKSKKTEIGIVAIHHSKAEILQEFTQKRKLITESLEQLPIGGKTNLIAGIDEVERLTKAFRKNQIQLVIITDGRFNVGTEQDVYEENVRFALKHIQKFDQTTVMDSEHGVIKLGLAKDFAERIQANYQLLTSKQVVD